MFYIFNRYRFWLLWLPKKVLRQFTVFCVGNSNKQYFGQRSVQLSLKVSSSVTLLNTKNQTFRCPKSRNSQIDNDYVNSPEKKFPMFQNLFKFSPFSLIQWHLVWDLLGLKITWVHNCQLKFLQFRFTLGAFSCVSGQNYLVGLDVSAS